MTAAIYIRKSREDKDKPAHRLTVQREQLPAYAAAQGWKFEIYDDGHASAARGKTENLQERNRLEQDIRAERINIILTIELSRLSRDDSMQDYVSWLHLCGEHRVKLATMSRTLDPSQHSDWMLLLMEGGFSSVEMKVLQARMKEGREQAITEGKFLGGQVPLPYVYDKAKGLPVIDPEELERMKDLWSRAQQKSARAVAMELGLAPISVRRALADDRLLYYQALRRHPKTGELIPCEWEPCMTAEEAERIKAARITRKKGYNRPSYGGLLSNLGILVCGYCGRSVRSANYFRQRPNGKRDEYSYYGCKVEVSELCDRSRRVPQSIVDESVITNVINTLANIDDLRDYWQATQTEDKAGRQLIEIEKEIAKLQAKKKRIAAAVLAEAIDFAEARTARLEVEAQIKTITQQQTAIKGQQSTEPEWEALTITREEFEALTQEEQRELLTLVVNEIRFYSSYLIIEYKFPRTPAGDAKTRIHLPLGGRSTGIKHTAIRTQK